MPYALHRWTELQTALAAQFPSWSAQGPAFMNTNYCAVTRAWVDGPYANYYFEYLCARGQKDYARRGNQCEHYAIRAALEAVDLFRQLVDPNVPAEAESIAVGWAKYFRADNAQWHEINLWFLDGVWTPWEPQTQSFMTLVPSEISTLQQFACP